VILHATFDYTKAAPAAQAQAKPAPPIAASAKKLPASGLVFEEAEAGPSIAAPVYGTPLMIAAILLVAFVIILRVAVVEISRNRMTPILYGVIVAAILLGLYFLPDYVPVTHGQPASRSSK
jgi:hypothetical protein